MNDYIVKIYLKTPFSQANTLPEYRNKNFSSNNCLSIYNNQISEAIHYHKQGKNVKFNINKLFGTDQGCYEISLLDLKQLDNYNEIIRPINYVKDTFAHIKTNQCIKIK